MNSEELPSKIQDQLKGILEELQKDKKVLAIALDYGEDWMQVTALSTGENIWRQDWNKKDDLWIGKLITSVDVVKKIILGELGSIVLSYEDVKVLSDPKGIIGQLKEFASKNLPEEVRVKRRLKPQMVHLVDGCVKMSTLEGFGYKYAAVRTAEHCIRLANEILAIYNKRREEACLLEEMKKWPSVPQNYIDNIIKALRLEVVSKEEAEGVLELTNQAFENVRVFREQRIKEWDQ